MRFPREQRVMWLSQARSVPFRQRVELAGEHGFGWLSTSPVDFDQTVASGLSASDQRRIAGDNGVRLSYLDPLTSWVPDWRPEREDADILPYLDRSPDDFLRVAEALHVDKTHLIGTFPQDRYSIDELVEHSGAYDVVIETAGVPSALSQSARMADLGARIALAGLPGTHSVGLDQTEAALKDLSIHGIPHGLNYYGHVVDLFASGRVDPTRLIAEVGPKRCRPCTCA